MFHYYLMHILGFLAIGYIATEFLVNKLQYQINMPDKLISSIIIGYSSFVLPAVILTYFFDSILDEIVFAHFSLGQVSIFIFVLISLKSVKKDLNFDFKSHDKNLYSILVIIGLIIGYIFITILYPERGWDALNFYFPNGIYFWIEEDIPAGFNPLSYYPTFKPPLNALLISYSLYVTDGMRANLHAIVFLLGTIMVIYNFTNSLTQKRSVSLNAVILFLTLPLTYLLIYEYAYYQELSLMFFFSSTIYLYKKMAENAPYHLILINLSFSVAILSKLSGLALFLIIPLIFRLKHIPRFVHYSYMFFLTLFMTYKASTTLYIGIGIFVFFLGIILMIVDYKSKTPTESDLLALSKFLQSMVIPIIISVIWILFMISIPNIREALTSRYISGGNEFVMTYDSINSASLAYLENGMRVSFLASILFLFTSTLFSLSWFVIKILGFIESKNYPVMRNWLLGYLLLFYGYHANVSGRYLVPIIVPFVILMAVGYEKLTNQFNLQNTRISQVIFMILAASSYLFFYPFLPIRNIFDQFNVRIFRYYSNQISLLIYLILITILIFGTIKMSLIVDMKKYDLKAFALIISLILVMAPFSVQLFVLADSDFDPDVFREKVVYYHRPAYQNLIDYINDLRLNLEEKIITVNSPGLGYFTLRSVIDLYLISGQNEFDLPLSNINVDAAYDFVIDQKVMIIIKLAEAHNFFPIFESKYANLSIMQLTSNSTLFENTYQNSDFSLYLRTALLAT